MKLTRRNFLKSTAAVSTVLALPNIALAEKKVKYNRFFAIYFKKSNRWYKIGVADDAANVDIHNDLLRIPVEIMAAADVVIDLQEKIHNKNNFVRFGKFPTVSENTIMHLKHLPVISKKYVAKAEGIKI